MMKIGRYWKDQGIVLKSFNFGEYDRIVTLFTRKKGKIVAIAKGARKVGNRFGPALDCPSISNFMFYDGQGMPVLSQAEIVECFRDFGKKTRKWVFAHYLLMAVDQCYEPDEPDERVYETVLFYLDLALNCDNFYVMAMKFRIDLFRFLGFSPRFQSCARCGTRFGKNPAGWSTALGGMVCEQCSQNQPDFHFLSPDIIILLNKFLSSSCSDCLSIHLNEKQCAFLDRLLSEYLTYHVGKKISEWKIFVDRFQEAS